MNRIITVCQDRQAEQSAAMCLSQGLNKMMQVGFEPSMQTKYLSCKQNLCPLLMIPTKLTTYPVQKFKSMKQNKNN